MRIGSCEACPAKDAIIEDLRKQLADTTKSMLFLADAKAAALRYPQERPAVREPAPPPKPVMNPQRLRETMYQPDMSPAEVEELFDLQAQLEKQVRGQ